MTITKLVFVDTETLSLPRGTTPPVPWEVAWICADLNTDTRTLTVHDWSVFQPLHAGSCLADADPMSLRIGGFYQRYEHALALPYTENARNRDTGEWQIMAEAVTDRWWVGAVPDFDEKIVRHEMHQHGLCLATHYHLIDVEAYAAGRFEIPLPWTLKRIMAAAEVERSSLGEHTAMGDTIDCVRLFGVAPNGLAGALVAERSWDDYALARADVSSHLGALDLVFAGVISSHRDVMDKLEDLDPVTQDIVIGQIAELESYQGFVRAHLAGASGTLATQGATTEPQAALAATVRSAPARRRASAR